jgi:hypothetical protein
MRKVMRSEVNFWSCVFLLGFLDVFCAWFPASRIVCQISRRVVLRGVVLRGVLRGVVLRGVTRGGVTRGGVTRGGVTREAPGCPNGYPQKAREGVSGTGLLRGPKSPRRCIGKGSRCSSGNVPGTCREFKFRISRPNPKSRIQKTAKTRFQNEQKTKIIYRSTISKHKNTKTQPSFFKLLYIVRLSLPRAKCDK